MAGTSSTSAHLLLLLNLAHLSIFTTASRHIPHPHLTASPPSPAPHSIHFEYHNGPLLTGNISINLIWYGKFEPAHRAIITDFFDSLSPLRSTLAQPSVATWWKHVEKYHQHANITNSTHVTFSLGQQILDEGYSLGKKLTDEQIEQLASRGGNRNAINIVLTTFDVAVEGFCFNRCGKHGSHAMNVTAPTQRGKSLNFPKLPYIWVGDSETQCPGQCTWPFHQPRYGPQARPLVPPNSDVGIDGMVINLAALLAGTVTNPFGNGYFQGPQEKPLEAASACPGVFGKGAYPGFPGSMLMDRTTGASFNAYGCNGRKYLMPALMDPATAICYTLV